MKKYLKPFILAALLLIVVFVWSGKYTVTSVEKYDEFSNKTYGYKIEKYIFWTNTKLTFWSNHRYFGSSSRLVYELPGLTVEKIEEERWLDNDTTIYLHLQLMKKDSMMTVKPARIIYDFHRGEIHASSDFTLWRLWNEKNKPEDWLKEDEFNAILSRFSK